MFPCLSGTSAWGVRGSPRHLPTGKEVQPGFGGSDLAGCALWGQGRQKMAPAAWVGMAGVTGHPREVRAQQAKPANPPAGSWVVGMPEPGGGQSSGLARTWQGERGFIQGKCARYRRLEKVSFLIDQLQLRLCISSHFSTSNCLLK